MKENIKNKEDFGLQVIDYFTEYFSLSCKEILEDTALILRACSDVV